MTSVGGRYNHRTVVAGVRSVGRHAIEGRSTAGLELWATLGVGRQMRSARRQMYTASQDAPVVTRSPKRTSHAQWLSDGDHPHLGHSQIACPVADTIIPRDESWRMQIVHFEGPCRFGALSLLMLVRDPVAPVYSLVVGAGESSINLRAFSMRISPVISPSDVRETYS